MREGGRAWDEGLDDVSGSEIVGVVVVVFCIMSK